MNVLTDSVEIKTDVWRDVPGFPEYELTENRHFRRKSTRAPSRPYKNRLRPNEGDFVDFWISGQRHAMSVDTIMLAAFKEKK